MSSEWALDVAAHYTYTFEVTVNDMLFMEIEHSKGNLEHLHIHVSDSRYSANRVETDQLRTIHTRFPSEVLDQVSVLHVPHYDIRRVCQRRCAVEWHDMIMP